VSDDWIHLAHELGFQSTDIAQIQKEYPDSASQQCMSMLNLWMNEISGQDSGKYHVRGDYLNIEAILLQRICI